MTKEQECKEALDKACNAAYGLDVAIYKTNLSEMDDEELSVEWCRKPYGYEAEFNDLMSRYGRDFVIDKLVDEYDAESAVKFGVIA